MKIFFVRIMLVAGFAFLFHSAGAQGFKPREYRALSRLGIEVVPGQNDTPQSIRSLHDILKKERQAKVSKTIGIVFSVFSAASLGFGTSLLLANKGNGSDSDVMVGSIGTIMLVSGGIYAGVAVPLLIHAKKKKKQRDRMVRSFKAVH